VQAGLVEAGDEGWQLGHLMQEHRRAGRGEWVFLLSAENYSSRCQKLYWVSRFVHRRPPMRGQFQFQQQNQTDWR